MVLQNRQDYGFNGYQVPPIPRATRSSRRRSSFENRFDDKQMLAFDLLASVAGNLLLERNPTFDRDTSTVEDRCENVKTEMPAENSHLKVDARYQGDCGRKCLVSEPGNDEDCSMKEDLSLHVGCSAGIAPELMISYTTTNTSKSVVAENLENKKSNGIGDFISKVDVDSPGYPRVHKLDSGNKIVVKEESEKVLSGAGSEICRLKDPVVFDRKPPHSFPTSRVVAQAVGRDDDHPTTSINSFQKAPRIGGQRIRKILASKNWKVAATYGAERRNIGGYTRQFYFNRRNSYKNHRSQMNIPFKKRKLFDGCISNCNGERRITQGFSDSTEKGTKRESSAFRKSSFVAGHQGDSRVKLRIKSFRVPELFIEIPETATVSSLKRTVMEAVTTVIGHGIHVGVLIRGKKIRDDNKTLSQTGISRDNQDDFLGFTLEPHSSQTPPSLCCENSHSTSPYQECIEENNGALLLGPRVDLSDAIGSDGEPVPLLADTPVAECSTGSKALVAVPAMAVEALPAVPVCQKPKRLEVGRRRMRRPFSVAEVEALVHAVETLGTGRWRDIKLRAFDNAKHRTYVDLKDKWKTLVHTARISPQQRRGEAVPQELLDRVLSAHAYWSTHQHHHQPHTCIVLP